jgi:hypothetical protein
VQSTASGRRLVVVLVAVSVADGPEEQQLPVLDGVGRRRRRQRVRLHVEEPRVLAEEGRGVDDAARLPGAFDAGIDPVATGRVEFS